MSSEISLNESTCDTGKGRQNRLEREVASQKKKSNRRSRSPTRTIPRLVVRTNQRVKAKALCPSRTEPTYQINSVRTASCSQKNGKGGLTTTSASSAVPTATKSPNAPSLLGPGRPQPRLLPPRRLLPRTPKPNRLRRPRQKNRQQPFGL